MDTVSGVTYHFRFSRHEDPDTEERLVLIKRALVTFAKIVMPGIILTFAAVYLFAVYLYLSD